MDALETYLRECASLRGIGVAETSYYGALQRLIDEAGRELKPPVRFVVNPRAVDGVTQGDIPTHLQSVAKFEWTEDRNPAENTPDLDLKANWGYRLPSGAVMPAIGKVLPNNAPVAQPGFEGQTSDPVTVDIVMNEHARWSCIPEPVWNYTLGGYQVLKKWLSYRERDVLGRSMKPAEVREFSAIARRITALLALALELDAHYQASKTHSLAEQGGET